MALNKIETLSEKVIIFHFLVSLIISMKKFQNFNLMYFKIQVNYILEFEELAIIISFD